mgnify:FL=1|jgi:hypothetical protein
MRVNLFITLCLSGTFAIGQTISQGIESTYDSPQGISQEIKSIRAIPEGVQWGDTTVGWCAHRIPTNGTTLLPWWYQSLTYVNGQVTEDYQSYYYGSNMSNVGYLKEFRTYIPDGFESEMYESSDSLNWMLTAKGKSRNVIGTAVDSGISYNWNAGMNKYILDGLTLTFKGSYGVDSVKQYDPLAQIFNYKTVNYRTNGTLDSIITYNNNSGWEPWDRTIYYGNYSIRYPGGGVYAPSKTYWDALGNAIAIVQYDFTTGAKADSSFSFYTGSRSDSSVSYDGAGIFTGASGARYSNTLHRFYTWDANMIVTNYQYRYFNLQGDYIGQVGFTASGQIRSKWGICAVYNSLETAENSVPTLRLSPNPTYGTIMLEGSSTNPMEYSIFDIGGRELLSGVTYANELIDVSTLSSGTYIIISSSGDTILKDRFVKL